MLDSPRLKAPLPVAQEKGATHKRLQTPNQKTTQTQRARIQPDRETAHNRPSRLHSANIQSRNLPIAKSHCSCSPKPQTKKTTKNTNRQRGKSQLIRSKSRNLNLSRKNQHRKTQKTRNQPNTEPLLGNFKSNNQLVSQL